MFVIKFYVFLLIVTFFNNSEFGTKQSENHQEVEALRMVECSHNGVSADYNKPLIITFNKPIHPNSLSKILVTKRGAYKEPIGANVEVVNGVWYISKDPRVICFEPLENLTPGMFISVSLSEKFKSLTGTKFKNGKDVISFITDNGTYYGHTNITIDTLKVKDGNVIPLIISLPKNSKKHPVLIYVHGGGWSGGTEHQSFASLPTGYFSNYYTDKLGVAVVGVAYRCKGSNGNFTKAKLDIEDAIKYIKVNADKYNLDLTRIGLTGESARAPLSALIAQEDKLVKYYIGLNGIYDFVRNNTSQFGQGNDFGQQTPSGYATSAIYNLRTNPPETLLIHGNKDITISYLQSVKFSQAIRAVGGKSNLLIYDNQPHWDFYAPEGNYEISTLYQIKEFLIYVMKLNVK